MTDDMKWISLIFIFVLGIPLVGLGIEKYQIHQCRIEAIKANMEAEKISQVCK
jgi:hypothetical protein